MPPTRRIIRPRAVLAAGCALLMLGACQGGPGASPPGAASSVVPLAKVDGWRAETDPQIDAFGVLEVAYDQQTAEQLVADNVPTDLPHHTGDPTDPGRYGDLADVDLETQVVALWSSGQSGSCPGWIDDVRTADDGAVTVRRAEDSGPDGACTDDYRPYRLVVAVSRDDVPAAADLPIRDASIDEGSFRLDVHVTEYTSGSG